jgi:hypothetical protein
MQNLWICATEIDEPGARVSGAAACEAGVCLHIRSAGCRTEQGGQPALEFGHWTNCDPEGIRSFSPRLSRWRGPTLGGRSVILLFSTLKGLDRFDSLATAHAMSQPRSQPSIMRSSQSRALAIPA